MWFKISIAMLAFAANSVLCRLALAEQQIDPMSFSLLRMGSGAVALGLLYVLFQVQHPLQFQWKSALSLTIYILGFSLAYLYIDAGVGALLLFGAVQITMISYAVWQGERMTWPRWTGLGCALLGMCLLLLPEADAPTFKYALMMLVAGIAWGFYSILAKNMQHALTATLSNFLFGLPLVAMLFLWHLPDSFISLNGVVLAVLSGALASGGAYVLWYSIVKKIDGITASTVQLSVPSLAILGGVIFLGEQLTWLMLFASLIVLCGILMVILAKPRV